MSICSRPQRRGRFVHAVLAALLVFVLCACQTEVHVGLTEEQANMMLSVLLNRGISAQKTSAGKKGFTISVSQGQLTQTLEILKEHNLPRQDFQSLGSVFSGQGMIASSTEEQARLSFAISEELSNTFSRIDGVLTARAHVVLESVDQVADVHTSASAAVFLRHVPDSPVINMVAKIRELTAKAVPGLDYEQVSVMLLPVRESISVPMQPKPTFWGISYNPGADPPYELMALLVLGIGLCTGVALWACNRLRQRMMSVTDEINKKE